MSKISKLIAEAALELGFERVGIVPVDTPSRHTAFEKWLDAGMHGEMRYMSDRRELRVSPSTIHPGSRSIVAVAASYHQADDDGAPGGIARYARGRDYHKVLRKRLGKLGTLIESELGAGSCSPRGFVDSAPILERDIAERAGIGWVGKSSNVIDQDLGSTFFLGELFVGHELAALGQSSQPEMHPDRCGRCTACIDLCPTKAIVEPYVVDARLCISYLTIELRGPIPVQLRRAIGSHLFGCDVCQIVCPWNRKVEARPDPAFAPRPQLKGLSAADFLPLTEGEFDTLFAGSPVRRTGRAGLARNAAIVLGNSGDPAVVPALVGGLRADPDPVVRGHCAWALGELATGSAKTALEFARLSEGEAQVVGEIDAALSATQ